MASLLNAVTTNTAGTAVKCCGPTTVFAESSNFGGGTVTIYVQRTSVSTAVAMGTFTAAGVQNININGTFYISATLAGATAPSALTVATLGLPS